MTPALRRLAGAVVLVLAVSGCTAASDSTGDPGSASVDHRPGPSDDAQAKPSTTMSPLPDPPATPEPSGPSALEPAAPRPWGEITAPGSLAMTGNVIDLVDGDPSPCSERLYASAEPPTDAAVLWRSCPQDISIVSPARALPPETTPQRAVEVLLEGPDEQESAAGFDSPSFVVPPGIVRAEMVGDVLVVDLSSQTPELVSYVHTYFGAAEITYTAGRAAGAERVSLLLNGEPTCGFFGGCVP